MEKVVEPMSEIMTYTKKMFDPLRPNVELIDIEDIAHALSMLCRFTGKYPGVKENYKKVVGVSRRLCIAGSPFDSLGVSTESASDGLRAEESCRALSRLCVASKSL